MQKNSLLHIKRDIEPKKIFQISIWGDALGLQYEPPTYLKLSDPPINRLILGTVGLSM
jgi:hypothetical protein